MAIFGDSLRYFVGVMVGPVSVARIARPASDRRRLSGRGASGFRSVLRLHSSCGACVQSRMSDSLVIHSFLYSSTGGL